MKNEIYNKWRKALLGFCLITSFLVGNSFNVLAQAPPGISISWDKEAGWPFPFQATLSDDFNNVLILPSSFTINPGMNTYQFTVIPQSPFNGGITNWTIQGSVITDEGYRDCVYRLQARVPKCKEGFDPIEIRAKDRTRAELEEELLQVYPNPARDVATVKYELASSSASLEVYDLLGKSMVKYNLTSAKGEVRLNTSTYASGVYIVVIRQKDGHVLQKKLVID